MHSSVLVCLVLISLFSVTAGKPKNHVHPHLRRPLGLKLPCATLGGACYTPAIGGSTCAAGHEAAAPITGVCDNGGDLCCVRGEISLSVCIVLYLKLRSF